MRFTLAITPLALACLAAATLCGCRTVQPAIKPYYGPTDPMFQVVQDINANNAKVRTLWAAHDFEALIYDEKGKSHAFSGSGNLMFRKPADLLLTATGIINFFEVGSNAEEFWFTAYPGDVSTQWWGRRENFTGNSAGMSKMPIRPDLLVEVLGVGEIDTDFMRPPVPVMRFNNDRDAYMLTWHAPAAGPQRWAAVKEVWYDRDTKQPQSVLLFDENGRVVLRAYLSVPKAIAGSAAKMATHYELFFPENKSSLSFTLTTLLESKRVGSKPFPNDNTFTLPTDPGVEKRIEIR